MKLTISLAQMDVAFGRPQDNLAAVEALAAEAAARGSDWLILPELWSTGYDLENAAQHATTTAAGVFAQLAGLARRYRLQIAGSALGLLGPGQFGNTLTWHTAEGELAGVYSKLHLFRLMQEEQFLTAGDAPQLVDTPWGRVGLAICYDLRFPELFRLYALAGAHFIVLPAEWPYPRLAHWQTLLRARAIENQLFVIACNRVGRAGETAFLGRSAIIDPWGETVIEGDDRAQLLTAAIDTTLTSAVRSRIPVFADRRPDCY